MRLADADNVIIHDVTLPVLDKSLQIRVIQR